jgi:hypothetical protein
MVTIINQRDALHRAAIRERVNQVTTRIHYLSDRSALAVQGARTMYAVTVTILSVLWVLGVTGTLGGFGPPSRLKCIQAQPADSGTCGKWHYDIAMLSLLLAHTVALCYSYMFVKWRTDIMTLRWFRTAITTFTALAGVYAQLPLATATTIVLLFPAVACCCTAAWLAERSRNRGMLEAQLGAKAIAIAMACMLLVVAIISAYADVSRFNRLTLVITTLCLLGSVANVVRQPDEFERSAIKRELEDLWTIIGNTTLDIIVIAAVFIVAVFAHDQ